MYGCLFVTIFEVVFYRAFLEKKKKYIYIRILYTVYPSTSKGKKVIVGKKENERGKLKNKTKSSTCDSFSYILSEKLYGACALCMPSVLSCKSF